MQEYMISFVSINDKALFVDTANQQKYNIELYYKDISIDGKSALGIMSTLPRNKPIKAVFYSMDKDVENIFNRWIIKGE